MKPLVSCICVTRNRRKFVTAAIRAFLAQDWPHKELVVIDDGEDPVHDLLQPIRDCRYFCLPGTHKIGVKRNLACEDAQGEIILHWDDDDWSASNRIQDQVERLIESGKGVSGYHSLLFWDGERAFRYKGFPRYSLGSALCYRKEFWRHHPFVAEDHRRHEDNTFVSQAQLEQQIVSVDGSNMMVARIHPGNTSPKSPLAAPQQWSQVDIGEIPAEFFRAIQ